MGGNPGKPTDKRPPLPLVRNEKVIEVVTPEGQDELTERYTDEALRFIREQTNSPFFLYFAHTAVHTPLHPGRSFKGKTYSPYGDWVAELDWSVGRVLDTVREQGLAQNTLVVFTSDNGPWLVQGTNGGVAGPLRGGKGSTWEGGVRVPTLAWWPGKIRAGTASDVVAANYDFLPTFAALAGGSPGKGPRIDGKDLSRVLLGQSTGQVHPAHFYFQGVNLQAVRSGPWKLAVARQPGATGNTNAPPVPRLYNLDSDIGEQRDVAAENPRVVKRLQKLWSEMDQDLGATKAGPGVRPAGRVEDPTGLWLPGHGPAKAGQ